MSALLLASLAALELADDEPSLAADEAVEAALLATLAALDAVEAAELATESSLLA